VPTLTLDCHYLRPQFAAAFVVVEGDHVAFVEANTAHALPHLLEGLRQAGRTPDQVDYVAITHVHLDHAGGVGALLAQCPRATVLAHPRATPHVVDPARLEASARKVYGDAAFDTLYGRLQPVDPSRIISVEDNQVIFLGSRPLRFLHTRGHANHHACILDETDGTVFTGDAFGLCYPFLQDRGLFIFPSTSPTDFDPVEARASVKRIVETGARRALLTHYGEVTDLAGAASQLVEHLDFAEGLLLRAVDSDLPDDALETLCRGALEEDMRRHVERHGLPAAGDAWELLEMDVRINAQGVAHVARKRRAARVHG
jgi:glyoxylase-like metal-dependent hydrolase (beta-lactamase superfamily II)